MELKERFFNVIFEYAWKFKAEKIVPACVKIADNYAIEFNKWTHNLRDCKDNTIEYNQWLNISDEELLRMFKKEKGL